jgi:hypothetical protein
MKYIGLRTLILIFAVALAMQAAATAEELPAQLQGEAVNILDIIQDISAYEGKNILIEGKIDT